MGQTTYLSRKHLRFFNYFLLSQVLDGKIFIFAQVDIPGPLGNSAISILESLPNLSLLNSINASNIIESGKHIVDSALQPRLPEWSPEESLAERVIGAMWLYLMTYRLADEEKIDETPVWYAILAIFFHPINSEVEFCKSLGKNNYVDSMTSTNT